jgi:hypothetical protein
VELLSSECQASKVKLGIFLGDDSSNDTQPIEMQAVQLHSCRCDGGSALTLLLGVDCSAGVHALVTLVYVVVIHPEAWDARAPHTNKYFSS